MKKLWLALCLSLGFAPAQAQQVDWPPPAGTIAFLCVYNSSPPTITSGKAAYAQCDSTGSLRITGTFTPSGTQNVNITQILSAAPSATNPLWVSPATASTPWVTAPVGKTTTQAKVTVSVTNTYQQALASSASRIGCTIQYVAVAGTKGYVFFGSAPADTTTSFQLTNGQSINCAIGGTAVATDAVQLTATATDIFVVTNQ